MNPDQRNLLCETLTEHEQGSLAPVLSAARSRRRARMTRQLAGTSCFLAAIALAGVAILQDAPALTSSSAASAPDSSRLELETIDDSQLLALLADQGPVLVTAPDGSQQLILTRPR